MKGYATRPWHQLLLHSSSGDEVIAISSLWTSLHFKTGSPIKCNFISQPLPRIRVELIKLEGITWSRVHVTQFLHMQLRSFCMSSSVDHQSLEVIIPPVLSSQLEWGQRRLRTGNSPGSNADTQHMQQPHRGSNGYTWHMHGDHRVSRRRRCAYAVTRPTWEITDFIRPGIRSKFSTYIDANKLTSIIGQNKDLLAFGHIFDQVELIKLTVLSQADRSLSISDDCNDSGDQSGFLPRPQFHERQEFPYRV